MGPGRLEWLDRSDLELDNFRAALQWGLDHDVMAALRLGGAQAIFWASRGLIMEGRQWLQAALDQTAALPESQGGADRQLQAAQANSLIGISQLNYGDGD